MAHKISFARSESWRTNGHKKSMTEVFVDRKPAGWIQAEEPFAYGGMCDYHVDLDAYDVHFTANSLKEAKDRLRALALVEEDK